MKIILSKQEVTELLLKYGNIKVSELIKKIKKEGK
jgi:hypothetical protein